ncbi:hypothetical protein ACFYW6_34125 [Streptomyces sp. NPDC002659]|uniref:hypothetical protein n=1 Tax=Streptomyces sp. NPDC002659 TaxID=3364656 RepID=UPI0036A68088
MEWLDRIRAEDAVEEELQRLQAASRRRRARALADGIRQLRTAAAVGRLQDPPVSGQAVSKYIRAYAPPQTSTGSDAEGEAAHAQ